VAGEGAGREEGEEEEERRKMDSRRREAKRLEGMGIRCTDV